MTGCDYTLLDTISFDVSQYFCYLESGLKKKGDDLTEIRGSLWESLLHNFVWVKGFYWHKRQNEEIQRRKMCQRWMQRYTLWLKSSCIADFWKLESTLRKWWLMPVVSVGGGFLRYLLWSCQRENMGTEGHLVRPGSFRTHVYERP